MEYNLISNIQKHLAYTYIGILTLVP